MLLFSSFFLCYFLYFQFFFCYFLPSLHVCLSIVPNFSGSSWVYVAAVDVHKLMEFMTLNSSGSAQFSWYRMVTDVITIEWNKRQYQFLDRIRSSWQKWIIDENKKKKRRSLCVIVNKKICFYYFICVYSCFHHLSKMRSFLLLSNFFFLLFSQYFFFLTKFILIWIIMTLYFPLSSFIHFNFSFCFGVLFYDRFSMFPFLATIHRKKKHTQKTNKQNKI